MPHQFIVRRRVAFSETDLAGLVHFSRFFVYMEDTEHAFYRSLGFNVLSGGDQTGWPRAHASCDYTAPLRFDEELEITLLVERKRSSGVEYRFDFRKLDGTQVARGRLGAVYVTFAEGRVQAAPLPPEIAARIEQAPPELLDPSA